MAGYLKMDDAAAMYRQRLEQFAQDLLRSGLGPRPAGPQASRPAREPQRPVKGRKASRGRS